MRIATVTRTGVGASAWLPLDHYTSGVEDGIFVFPNGGTVTIQVTPDDVFDPTVTPTAFDLPAPFAGATTNVAAALPYAAKAIRINQTVGAGTSTLKVAVRGVL